jgi:hypothetical protein
MEVPINEIQEITLEENENEKEYGANLRIAGTNLIYEETFEGVKPYSTAINLQTSTSYGITVANNPSYQGSKSGRFELRYGDPISHGGTRSEIFVINPVDHKEKWYSFASYFPSTDYKYDSSNEVISQWKQPGSAANAFTLRIQKDEFYLRMMPTDNSSKWNNIKLGDVTKDTWHEFVIHVVHSGKSDALIEIWKNGEKILTYKGPNNYDQYKLPYWKLGVYKPMWNSKRTATDKRVIYYDNIRTADAGSSYEEMVSGTGSTPKTETVIEPDPVVSSENITLSLVNAHTEKVLRTLVDNETISFSSLGTEKLNFKANVESNPDVQSVRFKLEGVSSHTYLDKSSPFALFGDDGNGNYYFGKILPEGKYKLTAYTYSDKSGNNLIGNPYSINFTIQKNSENQPTSTTESESSTQIISLSLVNAHTEKVVRTMVENETISFSSVGTQKLNFKANVEENPDVQSVRFKLEGVSSHTYLDKSSPFALFGDDGKGNYYFGKILPAGKYKITAYTYSDRSGTNLIGEPYSINFTVTN